MKTKRMNRRLGAAIVMAITAGQASAGILPVYDAANFAVNTANAASNASNMIANVANAATNASNLGVNTGNAISNKIAMISNLKQNHQLDEIRRQLMRPDEGSVTWNIDQNIQINTEIDADFTWIINQGSDEIIPIPFKDKLQQVMKGQDAATYTSHYKTVADYEKSAHFSYGDDAALESSRARKAANDAWVEALAMDEGVLNKDAESVKEILEFARKAKGHGRQLQVANSLAATEVDQLMKLRGMMLASDVARAAQAQAQADHEARAVAVGKRLREGLDGAIEKTKLRSASY